jgi:ribosomal protein L40E
MKAFDNRSAVEEYMSTHTLGYSTPDLILKEFVLWLCEKVDDPNGKEENIPRIMLYLKEEEERGKGGRDSSQTSISNLFNTITEPKIFPDSDKQSIANNTESKFCIECGSKLNLRSMFCTKCGTEQVEV